MPQLTPKELDQIRSSMAAAEDSVVIAMIKVVLSGGIDKVHPELLRIITDEINARGLSDQLMNESRKGKTMKLSKRQLRKIIREEYSRLKRGGLIKESMSPSDPNYELVGDVIEACKMECVDNAITHPDDVYEFCLEVARKHGVEGQADYIADIVHGYVAYVLN